jgi:hypothetical protein
MATPSLHRREDVFMEGRRPAGQEALCNVRAKAPGDRTQGFAAVAQG